MSRTGVSDGRSGGASLPDAGHGWSPLREAPSSAPAGTDDRLGLQPQRTGLTLSIQQPWAWLIVNGYKPVENRSWHTRVRGWIGIHAGLKVDAFGYNWVRERFPLIALPTAFEVGGIVGRARLTDCVTSHASEWFFGPFGFVLEAPEPLPFAPCRGQLGFFRLAQDDATKLLRTNDLQPKPKADR
jgi:hypothetical protein